MDALDRWRELPREMGTELGPRAVRWSRNSALASARRLRERFFFIAQCSVAAAGAWAAAHWVLGHGQPFFAPVTAIVALGFSYGHRLRRVFEIVGGVAIGVLMGDLFVHFFGSGAWQVALVALVSMSIASLLNAGMLVTIQAGLQSVIVTTLVAGPGQAFSRWLDAVAGGAVAVLVALVAPAGPVRRPRELAIAVVDEMTGILKDTIRVLRERDADRATQTLARARRSQRLLDELRDASEEGVAVVHQSPLRRGHRDAVETVAALVEPLDRTVRNLRVLVRRAVVAVWRDEPVPSSYVSLLVALAESTADVAAEMRAGRLPLAAREGLLRIGVISASIDPDSGLSGEVLRAQTRSIIVDLLVLTGVAHREAVTMVPVSDSAAD